MFYLFHIERNKNKNQVHYSLRLNQDCKIVSDESIYVSWLELESEKPKIYEIKWYEQIAYGIKEQVKLKPRELKIRLKALPERIIYIKYFKQLNSDSHCKVQAFTNISGKKTQLTKIYIFAIERFLLTPKVKYIVIHGKSTKGKTLKEKIIP